MRSRPIENITRTVVLWMARKQLKIPAIAASSIGCSSQGVTRLPRVTNGLPSERKASSFSGSLSP